MASRIRCLKKPGSTFYNDRMFKRKITPYFIAVLLLCSSLISLAAEPDQLYQFEVIVFSHITNDALQSEYWPAQAAITIPPNAIELADDQIVPSSQWQLSATQKFLEKNNYQILIHRAWQAKASALQQPQIIHLSGGDKEGDAAKQVNGSVTISLERYFNVHFDLQFLLPWASIQDLNLTNVTHADNSADVKFNLTADLRMRSNELNYIDHPLYGVLIEITPSPSL